MPIVIYKLIGIGLGLASATFMVALVITTIEYF